MKQFAWLYEKQVSLMSLLEKDNIKRVKCKDTFSVREDIYWDELFSFLRCEEFPKSKEAFKSKSPAFRKAMPKHSTGAFLDKAPYQTLEGEAKVYFEKHWKKFSNSLGYPA